MLLEMEESVSLVSYFALLVKYLTRSNLTDSVHLSYFDYKTLKVFRKLQVFAFSPHSRWPLRGLRQPSVRFFFRSQKRELVRALDKGRKTPYKNTLLIRCIFV